MRAVTDVTEGRGAWRPHAPEPRVLLGKVFGNCSIFESWHVDLIKAGGHTSRSGIPGVEFVPAKLTLSETCVRSMSDTLVDILDKPPCFLLHAR